MTRIAHDIPANQPRQRRTVRFALTPLAALLAGLGLAASLPAQAADEAAPADPAQAQAEQADDLGAVVVRSRNRVEKLQDVPISVSVVQGKELERLGATGINEITRRAANVSWNTGNQRTSTLSIRGLGKVGQTEAQDPSVGVIVDGVNFAYNALTSSFDFTDVDTIEVTRGPQGTLLGKNASVGVINITTRRPSFTPSADYTLSFGQRSTVVGTLAAGGPIVDGLLAYRVAFSASRGEGDIENAYNRDITYTNRDRVSGRAQFLFTPTDHLSARFAFDLQPNASETTNGRTINVAPPAKYANGDNWNLSTDASTRLARRWFKQNAAYSYADNYLNEATGEVNNDNQRGLVTGSRGAAADINWDIGSHTLTSISAYKYYHFNATNDDGTPFDIYRNSGGFWNDYKQVSQEFRLTSKLGGFVDYQGGLYFIKVDNDSEYQREWGNDAGAWFASKAQYDLLDADAAGRYLLQNSLDKVDMAYNSPTGKQWIRNKSTAVFGQANWHFTPDLTVTTGLRATRENRRNTGASFVENYGVAPELNLASVNGVVLGGFDSNGSGALRAGNSTAQLTLADQVAAKYFGVAATGTPGGAYNSLGANQKAQVAAAKAIRAANVGVLFDRREAESYRKTQPAFLLSPSYKINANQNAYLSLQHGEKAGIAQFVNGVSYQVKAEKTDSIELGLKSTLLNNTLTLNADVFRTDIKDYQQAIRVVDEYTTRLNNNGQFAYTSATGNVPKVQVTGLEIDGFYSGIRDWTLRFAGAYNKAIYKEFRNSAQPTENGYTGAAAYRDVSGRQLSGAPKFAFNVGTDYRTQVWDDKEFHVSTNIAYSGKYNSDVSLSEYGWIPANTVVDLAIGIGKRNKSFDASLLVKNAFDDDTPLAKTATSYTPAVPRWVGILLTGKI